GAVRAVCGAVGALKCARSSGRCQGRSLSRPITRWWAWAQIMPSTQIISRTNGRSDRDRCLDTGVVLVARHLDIRGSVGEQVRSPAQVQLRERERLPGQLLAHLVGVVGVDVA